MVSANSFATEMIWAFLQSFSNGMELVNIISVRPQLSIRSDAGSLIMACEHSALTDLAPSASMRSAALVIVPAVSTMSSTKNDIFYLSHLRLQSLLPRRWLWLSVYGKAPGAH